MAGGPSTGGSTRAGRGAGYLAPLVAVALAALLSGACVSIRMEEPIASPGVYQSGFLEVRVFETMSALRKDAPTKRQILCELYGPDLVQGRALVHRSAEPVWALADLEPGRYRLKVVGFVDEEGKVRSLGWSDWMDFDLAQGKGTRLSVVLSSGSGLANNVAYSAAWLGLALLCGHLDEHGVPCGP